MTKPARYEGDLRLWTLVREVARSFGENPIAIRLWSKMRRTVIVLMAVKAIASLLYSLPTLLPRSFATTQVSTFASWISTVLDLGVLLILAIAPFKYAAWSFKNSWTNDEALRLADQAPRERIIGMLTPFIAAFVFAHLPSLILAPVSLAEETRSLRELFGSAFIEGWASAIAATVGMWAGTVSWIVAYSAFSSVVVLRGLIGYSRPDAKSRFERGYLAWPTIRLLAVYLLILALKSIPNVYWNKSYIDHSLSTLHAASAPSPTGVAPTPFTRPRFEIGELFWVGAYAFMVAVDFLSIYVMHRSAKWYWRRDIPIAREFLFKDADDFVPPLMRADLRLPPPPPVMTAP